MASTLIDTLLRVLSARRDGTMTGDGPTVHDEILELLHRNDCQICERVTTTAETQAVHLLGIRGQGERPLWLVSSILGGLGAAPVAPVYDSERGRVTGTGAASGWADLVVKILAASRVPIHELRRPVCIAALEGLESQRDAALDLVGAPTTSAGVALVGAATGLRLWTSHSGSVTLKLSLERETRHRRMPPMLDYHAVTVEGRGAHYRASEGSLDAIARADELLGELRAAGTTRLLAIDGGTGPEEVSREVRMTLATAADLRDLPPGVSAEPLPDGASVPFPIDDLYEAWQRASAARPARGPLHVARIRSHVDRLEILLTVALDRDQTAESWVEAFRIAAGATLEGRGDLKLSVTVLDERPALKATAQDSDWLRTVNAAIEELGLPREVGAGRLTSDAGHLQSSGVPALVWGPGEIEEMFTPTESVKVEELERALEFYERMIRRWCT